MSGLFLDFFSHESKVSLQLPVGWEEMEEGDRYVIYYESLDDEENDSSSDSAQSDERKHSHDPKFIIRTFGLPAADTLAYRQLSAQILNQPRQRQEILAQAIGEVDGFEATIDLFTYFYEPEGCTITQYQVFVQIAQQIVCSITGMTEDSLKEKYLPVFEQAVQSIRFIPV